MWVLGWFFHLSRTKSYSGILEMCRTHSPILSACEILNTPSFSLSSSHPHNSNSSLGLSHLSCMYKNTVPFPICCLPTPHLHFPNWSKFLTWEFYFLPSLPVPHDLVVPLVVFLASMTVNLWRNLPHFVLLSRYNSG